MASFQEFLKRTAEDKELQEKFTKIFSDGEIADKTAATVALAKEYGVELTGEDIKAFVEAAKDENGQELTDDELDNVAGGTTYGSLSEVLKYCGVEVLKQLIAYYRQ